MATTNFYLKGTSSKSLPQIFMVYQDRGEKCELRFLNYESSIITTANNVFIKLWLDIKQSTITNYFAFVVN